MLLMPMSLAEAPYRVHGHQARVEQQDAAGLRLGEPVGAADVADVALVPADAAAVDVSRWRSR